MTDRDQEIQQLTELIQKKKDELAKVKKYSYNTHMAFNALGINYNLHTIDDVSTLISFIAHLETGEAAFKAAIVKYNLPKIEFKHQSYPVSDWIEDIIARINKVNSIKETRNLSDMEAALNNLLSQDFKVNKELEQIKNKLK